MNPSDTRLRRVTDYLELHAERTPDAQATSHQGTQLSYRQLALQVEALGRALLAKGVQCGDRVATLSPPNPDFLVTFLATISIGGVWLGLNPRYTRDEYAYVLADARPSVLFSRLSIGERDYRDTIADLQRGCPSVREVIALDDTQGTPEGWISLSDFVDRNSAPHDAWAARKAACEPGDPALLVYTSGSTGAPKGALLPHRGLVTCSRVQARFWDASPARILNFLPINHVGCVGDISAFLLVVGGCNVFMEQFDPVHSLELIEREKITTWGGIPTTIEMCLNAPQFAEFDLSSIQMIVWSGAAASRSLIDRMRAITPRLSTSYGLTESVGSITYVPVGSSPEALGESVGAPAPDYEFRIMRDDGAKAAVGETGEIQLRGPHLMIGYFNRPEETEEALDKEGWLHTGDLGIWREDGTVKLVGRMSDMFKSGGYNVYPREIEIVLEKHPDVAMAAIVGAPDPLYGETGHAFVTPTAGARLSESELQTFCRQSLANYKIPKRFWIVDQLPLLPVGKVDKKALKARLASDGKG